MSRAVDITPGNPPGWAADDWRTYPPLELPPILTVALAEIVDNGYHATSVRTIARHVGVTVPALYYHFDNKQAMLVALLDYAMDTVLTHTQKALEEAGTDPVERLKLLVNAIALYMAHHRDLAFLDSERRALTPENLERYVAQRDQLEHQLREIIETGVHDGEFKTTEPAECSRAIFAMCQGVAGWYDLNGPISPVEIARRYERIALAAVEYDG
jgi:AcrR family transcriptional regulator